MTDESLTEFLHSVMPFSATLGIRGVSNSPAETVMEMDWSPERCTTGGVMHGGAIMALADTCGAALTFGNLPEGATGTTTIEGKTNMIRAVTEGTVTARSTVVHAGRQTVVVETDEHLQNVKDNLSAVAPGSPRERVEEAEARVEALREELRRFIPLDPHEPAPQSILQYRAAPPRSQIVAYDELVLKGLAART